MNKHRILISLFFLMAALMVGCGKRAVVPETEPASGASIEMSVQPVSVEASTVAEEATKEESVEEESPVAASTASTEDSASVATTAAPVEPAPADPAPAEPAPAEEAPVVEEPKAIDYGRIVFAGDSRTVDMFDWDQGEIRDEVHDGMRVFCRDGCKSQYMIDAVNYVGYGNFDTLISWMGCNDYGNFEPYRGFYEEVLAQGKNLILCTVGPTNDGALVGEFDQTNYTNDRQVAYNAAMQDWAAQHGVKVIQLYDYINAEIANGNIQINPEDGIHYLPQPTTIIWKKILSSIG